MTRAGMPRSHALSLLLLAGVAVLGSAPARAQPAQAAQQAPAPAGYQELVDVGLAESSAGRFEEARAKFRQAHALYPNARTARVIGMVAFELRDYVDAVRNLELALAEPRRALDDAQRFQVSALLDQARGYVARYETRELPSDTTLLVDGRPAVLDPGGVLVLAIGPHKLLAKHAGQSVEASLTVRGGERGPLPIVVDALPAQAVAVAPVPVAAKPDEIDRDVFADPAPVERAPEPSAFPIGPALTIGAGVVLAAAGAVLLLSGLSDVAEVEDAQRGTEWATLQDADDRSQLMTGLGAGLLALGGVTGTIGVVWVASDGGSSEQLALRVGGGGTW